MNLKILAAKIVDTLRTDGIAVTLKKSLANIRHRSVADDFDQLYGVDTATVTPLWEVEINSGNAKSGVRYQAVDPNVIPLGLALINVPVEQFSFVDLGSGKGRSLIIAAKIGFRIVIGVEYAKELVEVSLHNLEATKVTNVSVLHEDAASYELPAGNLVIFMYNPFKEEVMEKVVSNICTAVAARPNDKIFVLYFRPDCAAVLDAADCLRRIGSPTGRHDIIAWKGQIR